MEYDIEIVERQREDTAVIKGRVAHGAVGVFVPVAIGEIYGALGEDPIVGPPFCRVNLLDEEFALEVGFPVERPIEASGRIEPSTLPAGPVATALHVGPYDTIAPAYGALEQWMREHHYVQTGAPWEAYLDGPEVENPRTLVCWPCHRAEGAPSA
ncbi:MAG: transcriptional regulator [Actinomycetales bacterium]|nr:transcriptional regulator [Actinomycetales bacterium]